ncbi:MAG: 2-C-methyl-D-erythritol 4-phosphate cytidylyltransferase [Rhodoluna sp.]
MTVRDLAVVVVAAGLGTRLGADKPKAFVSLANKTLLQHSLENIADVTALEQVIIAVPTGLEKIATDIAEAALAGKNVGFEIVTGGATRQKSIANALKAISAESKIVLVHDAARALAPTDLFNRVAAEVRRTENGVVPVLRVADTIKRVEGDSSSETVVLETVDREVLRIAQTPQGFVASKLLAAYNAAKADFTDDAALAQEGGIKIVAVEGDEAAVKITTAQDLTNAEKFLTSKNNSAKFKTGIGTDVHRFSTDSNKKLFLGTIEWSGERGLDGHSDGDAVSHAIVDALLAAAALGDIGSNFGVDRPEFAGANGKVFIEATLELLAKNGYSVGNVSVQLIGNRPKVAPMRERVERVLTEIIGAPVSFGATTTDGLGFLGNDEGVAAVATALIQTANQGPKGRLAS